jgi:hypothetical protein
MRVKVKGLTFTPTTSPLNVSRHNSHVSPTTPARRAAPTSGGVPVGKEIDDFAGPTGSTSEPGSEL